jgi:hypothetical protein
LLTGHCGPKSVAVLDDADIRVVEDVAGTVREAVARYTPAAGQAVTRPELEPFPRGQSYGGGPGAGQGRGWGYGPGAGQGRGRGRGYGPGASQGRGRGCGPGAGQGRGCGRGQGRGYGLGSGRSTA